MTLRPPPGLWFFRDPGGNAVASWLEGLGPPAANESVCLVPRGAPLLERRSAISNARILVELGGRVFDKVEAITALRTVEIPDRLLGVRSNALSPAQRMAVWLAIGRLRGSRTIVVIEPFLGVPREDSGQLARLIREMATADRTVLVVSANAAVGEDCHALPVHDLSRPIW